MLEAKALDEPAAVVRLSPRGKEIFLLYMSGLSFPQIAEKLGISLSAVRRQQEKMLWQNNCESILKLIAKFHAQKAEKGKNNI